MASPEQEAGVEEFDSTDRRLIWSATGGQQRFETGFVDQLVKDDVAAIRAALRIAFQQGVPAKNRSAQIDKYLAFLAGIDPTAQLDASALRNLWERA